MGAMIRADAKGVSAWAKDRGWTTATDRAMQVGRSTRRFVDLLSEERSSGGDAGARKTPKITVVAEQRAAKRAKLEDDVVPNTPNKLPRMKGGNPDGKLCKDFMKGKCKGATCSFSHEKPPTTAPDDD